MGLRAESAGTTAGCEAAHKAVITQQGWSPLRPPSGQQEERALHVRKDVPQEHEDVGKTKSLIETQLFKFPEEVKSTWLSLC